MRLFIILLALTCLVSCRSAEALFTGGNTIKAHQEAVDKDIKKIEESSAVISKDGEAIKKQTSEINKKDPKGLMDPELSKIDSSADSIISKASEITMLAGNLKARNEDLAQEAKKQKALLKDNASLKKQLNESRKKYFTIIYSLCGLIIALSLAACLYGNTKAIVGAIFGGILAVVAVVFEQALMHAGLIAIVGGGILIAVIIREVMRKRAADRALDQTLDNMSEEQYTEVFGVQPEKTAIKTVKTSQKTHNVLKEAHARINKTKVNKEQ